MADSPSELQFEIEKLERKHAENPEGRFFVPLANAYRKMGDVETAEALLRSGVERHPDYLSAHIVLGRCLADRGAVGEAEEEFRFVLSQDPQNLIALRTLGELAVGDGRPGEAADWYRELLAVDPMNEDARQALDALSDAPAPEEETEFRSGAGWWEPTAEGADATTETEGAPSARSEAFAPAEGPGELASDERPEVRTEESSEILSGIERFEPADEPASGDTDTDDLAVERYGWDDLSGLPEDQAAETPERTEPFAEEVGAGDSWSFDREELPGLRSDEAPEEEDLQAAGAEELPDAEPSAGSEVAPEAAAAAAPLPFTDQASTPGTDEDEDDGARYTSVRSSEVVTETIAELYARQGLHERAASVYRELIRRRGGDEALERRLAEVEGLARAEQAADADEGLALADEEALVSPTLDARQEEEQEEGTTEEQPEEEDFFAGSFAGGFATFAEDEPSEPAAELASAPGEPPDEVSWEEHPLPELAPEAASSEPPGIAQPAGRASISDLLRGLATWRSTHPSGPDAPVVDSVPSAPAVHDAAPVAVEEEVLPEESVAEPWESPADVEAPSDDDLPYLERAGEAPAAGGTGSADDEPFPWELPGATGLEEDEGGRPEAAPAAELDPFFVDEAEPLRAAAEEPLSEAAAPPAPEVGREPTPEPRAPDSDPSEDEDLESFQAWLRSLKR